MSNNNFIIAILGKSASGKSSIEKALEKQHGYKRVISVTSRPIRQNEANHIDYHFVTDEKFQELINNDKLIEYRCYNTIENNKPAVWHYGITKDEIDLDKYSYVCVVDIKGLQDLEKAFCNKVISFYIDVPDEVRKIRAIARDEYFEENEFKRRNKDDKIKFSNVENKVDMVVKNDNFDECLSRVLCNIDYVMRLKVFYNN